MKTKHKGKIHRCVNCGYPMLTPKETDVFRILNYKPDKWHTTHEINRSMNCSVSVFTTLLHAMVQKNVVLQRNHGKTQQFKINADYLENHNLWSDI